jgi:glyoxylase-like metal-dependent hydrolase (beta-lactamase superfamily II)
MSVRLHALTCGWLEGPLGLFLDGEHGRLRVPVPVFLIEHPRGRVVFDAGLHPDARRDPDGRLGATAAGLYDVELGDDEHVGARLAALGVDPAGVDLLLVSHLHFDHVGGAALLPNARLVVQEPEWHAGRDADLCARNYYRAIDYDVGHAVETVRGEHDVFGDGRVVCVPTYGHTPGHQSLRVRLDDGREVVLTADACYLRRTLETRHLPPIVFDRDAMLASLERLRALRAAGAELVYGHDPEAWQRIPQAPASL